MRKRRHGLPPRARLRRGRDYERAYRQGSRARGSTLAVVVVENGLGLTRMGLAVGRRVWKSAVRRNRVRRVFREAFRLELDELPRGLDIVLMAAQPRLRPDLAPTRAELRKLVTKAHRRLLERRAAEAGPDPAGEPPTTGGTAEEVRR